MIPDLLVTGLKRGFGLDVVGRALLRVGAPDFGVTLGFGVSQLRDVRRWGVAGCKSTLRTRRKPRRGTKKRARGNHHWRWFWWNSDWGYGRRKINASYIVQRATTRVVFYAASGPPSGAEVLHIHQLGHSEDQHP